MYIEYCNDFKFLQSDASLIHAGIHLFLSAVVSNCVKKLSSISEPVSFTDLLQTALLTIPLETESTVFSLPKYTFIISTSLQLIYFH